MKTTQMFIYRRCWDTTKDGYYNNAATDGYRMVGGLEIYSVKKLCILLIENPWIYKRYSC